jgi:phosphate acetyltransferase
MQEIIAQLRERAKRAPKRFVFPEAEDGRVLEAVKYIDKEKIAYPYLLTAANIESERQEEFATLFYEYNQRKGINFNQAKELMGNPLYYAAMMVRCGEADGFVAGAIFTTSSVIRAALRCLEIDVNIKLLSSCFIIVVPDCSYGDKGVFVYADCAVIPNPTSEQLALIAISTANFAEEILGLYPRIAFLSFSTRGSASVKGINKIKEAVEVAKSKSSKYLIDGELQADAAIIPEVAKRKLGDSKVAGKANVLIFPNLDAGNICYKLTQRLAKARAIGPIILGTEQPCSDLSRGCSVEDIIDSTAVTVIRAQKKVSNLERDISKADLSP